MCLGYLTRWVCISGLETTCFGLYLPKLHFHGDKVKRACLYDMHMITDIIMQLDEMTGIYTNENTVVNTFPK